MDAISFGEWLRRNRRSLGLTQAQLAGKVNCATITLRKIEAEERKPSAQIAEQLAHILEIPDIEHNVFVNFARGDWHMVPAGGKANYPWHSTTATNNIHIPARLTTLVGRDNDISSVKILLSDSNVRLVTLAGPPGVGKTHLSQGIAHAIHQQFPEGVFFVSLASIKGENLIAATILKSLGMKGPTTKSSLESLIHAVADKQTLLILDNIEHLIKPASKLIYKLLMACPRLKILATSREVLRLNGEQVYPVLPLEIPTELQLKSLDINTASQFSALALFTERARAVQPTFSLNQENLQAVVKICEQLDGLPLAIELLATRIKLMTPQVLLSHMNRQFILTVKAPRPFPPHQETLSLAIQRSYDLLTASEKRLLTLLSVFSGGVSLSMIERTFSAIFQPDELNDLITSLLDKSLLQSKSGLLAEHRLSMFNTINLFATEQLANSGDFATARQCHFHYFHNMAETAYREIHHSDQLKWISQIDIEQDNFKAALEYALSINNLPASIIILNTLGWLWFLSGNYSELVTWFEKNNSRMVGNYSTEQYAALLNLIAQSMIYMGEPDRARSLLKDSLVIAARLGENNDDVIADAMSLFGFIMSVASGRMPKARFFIEQALTLHQKIEDTHGMAMDYIHLACLLNRDGQLLAAVFMAENSLQLFKQLNDMWGQARCYQMLGQLSLGSGQLTRASWFFNQQHELDVLVGFTHGQRSALASLRKSIDQQGEIFQDKSSRGTHTVANLDYEIKEISSKLALCML